jgi:hypothetical protein
MHDQGEVNNYLQSRQCSNAAIHLSHDARRIGHPEAIKGHDFEPGGFYQPIYRAIYITSRRDDALDRVEAILAPCDRDIITAPVFEEDEPAAGFQYTGDLGKRRGDIGDRAERHCCDYSIESPISKRHSPARVKLQPDDRNGRFGNPSFDPALQHILGIDAYQLRYCLRVIGKIETRAEAYLQRLTAGGGER